MHNDNPILSAMAMFHQASRYGPRREADGKMERKAINKEGRHVGLDFYDLLIEGHFT